MAKTTISKVHGRRVWDSRGRPTVEVEITLEGGAVGRAIAPAGASRGRFEAIDLRDGGKTFGGWDVQRALDAVKIEISETLMGQDARDQEHIDGLLIQLDGTGNKKHLGGNATVATSMAVAHAAAHQLNKSLWRMIREQADTKGDIALPLPEIQIFGGGAHASQRVDVQDFMVIANGADSYRQSLDWTAEVYRHAGLLMADAGKLAGVADEGGFWPDFDSNEDALEMLVRAIESAGYRPGVDVSISLDIAASEFGKDGTYVLAKDNTTLNSEEMCALLVDWMERYPIISIEDPLGEDDPDGLMKFFWATGEKAQVVGDDLLVTNADRVRMAAKDKLCNTLLVKPNQAGTLTEAKAAFDAATKAGFGQIVSARSGETEDVTIVHLAVGWGVPQLKVGSFTRSERMAKWNEGLRVADELGLPDGPLAPRSAFPWR